MEKKDKQILWEIDAFYTSSFFIYDLLKKADLCNVCISKGVSTACQDLVLFFHTMHRVSVR